MSNNNDTKIIEFGWLVLILYGHFWIDNRCQNLFTLRELVVGKFTLPIFMKSLIPKGAKSTFNQNRVINITTLFSLPPTFRTHF